MLPKESHLRTASTPLDKLQTEFLDSMKASGRNENEHRRKTLQRLRDSFNKLGWSRLCHIDADQFRLYLEDFGTAKTANHYRTAVIQFLRWLQDHGRIEHNPLERIKARKGGNKQKIEKAAFTLDEIQRLAEVHPQRGLVYLCLAYFGLRQVELHRLKIEDLRLDGPTPWVLLPASESKAKRYEPLPIHDSLVEPLRRLIEDRPLDSKVWPHRFTRGTFTKDMKRAGISKQNSLGQNRTPHCLRYSFVTLLQFAGVEIQTVQSLARHRSLDMTKGVYTDRTGLGLHEAINKLPPVDSLSLIHSLENGPSGSEQKQRDTTGRFVGVSQVSTSKADGAVLGHRETPGTKPKQQWSRGESNPRPVTVSMTPLHV